MRQFLKLLGQQWRSKKFGLGGAVVQFWLKSLINIEIEYIKG